MKSTVCKFGDLTAVTIPAALLKTLNLGVGDTVDVKSENGQLIIESAERVNYSLAELLAQGDPQSMSIDEEDAAWLNSTTGKEAL